MIKGLTHDDNGLANHVVRYRGKISTGFAPGEGPNKTGGPQAAGFFRMLKEVITNPRIGQGKQVVSIKKWVVNEPIQKALEVACGNNPMPKKLEFICLGQTPADLWDSNCAMFTSDGLACKSEGRGTVAKYLDRTGGNRKWTTRECLFTECPDFKKGDCKCRGQMKCYPIVDFAPNPYRFETSSLNTISGIESAIGNFYTILKAVHMIKQIESGNKIPFEGLFGCKFSLVHRKTKSGGRNVFVTDLMPTAEFTKSVMIPLKRGLEFRTEASQLVGSDGSMSFLDGSAEKFIVAAKDAEQIENLSVEQSPIELLEQQIQENFDVVDSEESADPDRFGAESQGDIVESAVTEEASKNATMALLDGDLTPQK